ncbi:ROK family protein [Bauldia sp.]|uniref:ROK family protein n=1 Tax=Bauldia sp. TaxID=2575872 RepID=UPI0025BC12E1|nr:ROK family protein [Bauldia sp.]
MEAIGVDVGGTNLRVARVDLDGNIRETRSARTDGNSKDAFASIIALSRELTTPAVVGIGIGVPGRVDVKERQVLSGGFLDLSGFGFAAAVETAIGRPVVIDTDANLALVAEWIFGAARGTDNAVMLTIGTGIGGAAVVEGRILRGMRCACQFGHVTVERPGRPCACGRSGCVETTSSGTRLGQLMLEAGLPGSMRAEALADAAEAGEAFARDILVNWAGPLRAAIDSLVASLDPERIVLGGGLGAVAARALSFVPAESPWYQSEVVPAALGDTAGVVGGAWVAANPEQVAR